MVNQLQYFSQILKCLILLKGLCVKGHFTWRSKFLVLSSSLKTQKILLSYMFQFFYTLLLNISFLSLYSMFFNNMQAIII